MHMYEESNVQPINTLTYLFMEKFFIEKLNIALYI